MRELTWPPAGGRPGGSQTLPWYHRCHATDLPRTTMNIGFEILIILLLIVLNGLFAMSELALVSARRARLATLPPGKVIG